MPVTNIYYKSDTGHIVGYQGGGSLSPADEIPAGCKRVAFANEVSIMDPHSHRINRKVDLTTKQLIPLVEEIPLTEENEEEYLSKELSVAEKDLVTAINEGLKDYRIHLQEKIEDIKIRLDRIHAKKGEVTVADV